MGKMIHKIPIEEFLDLLIKTYEKGFNYFDLELHSDPDNIKDNITVLVRDEYHDKYKDESQDTIPTKITDSNINDLL